MNASVPCHTNADCPQGTYQDRYSCFIPAPIGDGSTCATAPAGRCVSTGSGAPLRRRLSN